MEYHTLFKGIRRLTFCFLLLMPSLSYALTGKILTKRPTIAAHSIIKSPFSTLRGNPSIFQLPSQSPAPEQIQKAREMLEQNFSSEEPTGSSTEQEQPEPDETTALSEKEVSAEMASTVPIEEEDMSSFEVYTNKALLSSDLTDIRQFGYSLFEQPLETLASAQIIPVGPDYLLGPGDEFKISLWGKINAEYSPVIDRDGKINLPQIGVLYMSGLTFSEAKGFLQKELSRHYKRSGVKMNVSMGKLRSIRVFVVGKAKRPGSYILSSLSTLINALVAAGGPDKVGTLRDIQVKRNGKTVVHFDLYDFLLKGDKTRDIRLMSEDVVFIPTIGPLVGVAGNVKVPAIYELKGKARLKEVIAMAGGVNASGYLQHVQIERIYENQKKIVLDLDITGVAEKENIYLKDGDIVKIFAVNEIVTNSVTLMGNVYRPGKYEWRKGIRIKDIIRTPDDLIPDTFLEFALIERLVSPDYHKEYVSFNPAKLFFEGDETENIPLMPYDTIVVFYKWDIIDLQKVRISGAVNKPGGYEYRPNMKLSHLLKIAGGLKRYAYREEAELTRIITAAAGPETERIIVSPEKAMEGNLEYDIFLKEDDYLFIKTIPEWELYRTVTIKGEVKFPGTYTIKKGEKISFLIERAGGFTDKAYFKGAAFTRESVRELQQKQLDDSINRLEREILSQSAQSIETAISTESARQQQAALEQKRLLIAKMKSARAKGRISIKLDILERFRGTSSDLVMEDGDTLVIPEVSQQVQVIGSVYNVTAFVYNPKASISSYLKQAGGITKNADKKEIFIIKADGTAISKREEGWGFMSMKLDPGDTIVVPEKIERIAWLREVKDITQILYQIAVTTGVMLVAF